jgi:hypothetical protein
LTDRLVAEKLAREAECAGIEDRLVIAAECFAAIDHLTDVEPVPEQMGEAADPEGAPMTRPLASCRCLVRMPFERCHGLGRVLMRNSGGAGAPCEFDVALCMSRDGAGNPCFFGANLKRLPTLISELRDSGERSCPGECAEVSFFHKAGDVYCGVGCCRKPAWILPRKARRGADCGQAGCLNGRPTELHAVAMLLKKQALEAHLDTFGIINALRHMRKQVSAADSADEAAPGEITFTLAWTAPSSAAVKGIVHEPVGQPTMKAETRDALLAAIAKNRQWIDDLRLGRAATLAEIAAREGVGERYVRLLAPLAFVAPRFIAASADGTAPADLTVSGLAKSVPYGWAEQESKCLPVVDRHDVRRRPMVSIPFRRLRLAPGVDPIEPLLETRLLVADIEDVWVALEDPV